MEFEETCSFLSPPPPLWNWLIRTHQIAMIVVGPNYPGPWSSGRTTQLNVFGAMQQPPHQEPLTERFPPSLFHSLAHIVCPETDPRSISSWVLEAMCYSGFCFSSRGSILLLVRLAVVLSGRLVVAGSGGGISHPPPETFPTQFTSYGRFSLSPCWIYYHHHLVMGQQQQQQQQRSSSMSATEERVSGFKEVNFVVVD